jgi:hypothetical protein
VIQFHAARLVRLVPHRHPVYLAAMTRAPGSFEDIRQMADDVAGLMASRFGGAGRSGRPTLQQMLRRRGGALPSRLRRRAARLARADRLACQPRVARQLPLAELSQDHAALTAYLKPLGEVSRAQGRLISVTARLVLALLILGAVTIWLMAKRGHL